MLRLNNQNLKSWRRLGASKMIIPNAGSVTALPVFLGKLYRYYSFPFLTSFLPNVNRVSGYPVMKIRRELQGMHYFIDVLIFKCAGKLIHFIFFIIKTDLHVIPSFQLQRQLCKGFFTEYQFVLHPGSLFYRAIGG